MWNEISCTKLQLSPETLTRGLPPPDPRSLCPQLNLFNPPPEQNSWVRHWLVGYVAQGLVALPTALPAGFVVCFE